MIFEQVRTGGDRNFGYFIADRAEGFAAVIDPSGSAGLFFDLLDRHGCVLKYVILTHDHFDHTGGASQLASQSSALVVMHKITGDSTDLPVDDGELLSLGELELKVIHTPGHTADSICVLCGDLLMTGDTLFVGKVGGTDLGSGARSEYDSLHKKLMTLPGETRVYPGHDYGVAPSSTIGHEKSTNPFILCRSFEEFVDLKANWAEYKRTHGIA
ncbi:MAG: MBL fold metallo-hydrolase [Candidatus Glassbacteria bacterium]|nr:MBL fold metallo-hydrolase [Candidatus Glassbacteria bacterium]